MTLESGKQLPMSTLRAGDKVQSVAEEGCLIYDEVYFFGHQDSSAMGTFVALEVHLPERPAVTIYLSPRCDSALESTPDWNVTVTDFSAKRSA